MTKKKKIEVHKWISIHWHASLGKSLQSYFKWYWSCWWIRILPCMSDISGYDMQDYVSWDVHRESPDN